MNATRLEELPPAPLWRRLLAAVYDTLLLIALLMVATFPAVLLNDSEAVTGPVASSVLFAWLLVVGLSFFAVFWHTSGQTLGMRAWRLRVHKDGGRLSWRDAYLRGAAAIVSWLPAGLGYLIALADAGKRTWHDRMTGTGVVVLPRGDAGD